MRPPVGVRGRGVVAAERLTVLEILKRATTWLGDRGVENPRLDAELLVAHGLGLGRLQLYLEYARPVVPEEADRVRELIRQRGAYVPVAYLLGEREFWSLAFLVGPDVLVPRPETEHLVEVALAALGETSVFADVGTGCGCVAIALLHELPAARAHATDLSPGALSVARANAERQGVAGRLELRCGDLLEPLRAGPDWGRLDAVVCNPPYIVPDDPSVERGVREHEPGEALFVSGNDPLEVARRLARSARDALRPGGLLALEIGAGSGADAQAMLEALGYGAVRTVKDLAKIDRIVAGVL